MTPTAQKVLILASVGLVVGVVLIAFGMAGPADEDAAPAGFAIFVLSLFAAVAAALLGDRTMLPPGRSRLQPPGGVAIGLAGAVALIAVVSLANELSPGGCDRSDFTWEQPPEIVRGPTAVHPGELAGLPPQRVCRLFGGEGERTLIATVRAPDWSAFWIALIAILSPIAISMGWRAATRPEPEGRPVVADHAS